MGVHDDAALALLAEDIREADARDDAGAQDVPQDCAGSDGRQLVDIADKDDMRAVGHGRKEVLHERDVHHRDLVEDDDVGLELLVLVLAERRRARAACALRLEHAVNGHGLLPRRLSEPLGGASRRRAEQHREALQVQEVDHAAHDRRLARAGAAGQHEDAVLQYVLERLFLLVSQPDARDLLPARDERRRVSLHRDGVGILLQVEQFARRLDLRAVEVRRVDERL